MTKQTTEVSWRDREIPRYDEIPNDWARVHQALIDADVEFGVAGRVRDEWQASRFGASDAIRAILSGAIRPADVEYLR